MSISPQSRYNAIGSTIVRVLDANGQYNLTVLRTVSAAFPAYRLYVWKASDRPDIVAQTELGNPMLWWSIFDINPEIIYPLNIPAGTAVRIPVSPVMGQGTLVQ